MKRISPYTKMKVLGAIDYAEGDSITARIKAVSQIVFTDEDGDPCQFTWRTISTWLYRYKSKGVTSMDFKPRSDKGCPRKVEPEKLLEAIEQALPYFHNKRYNIQQIYRKCIELGLLQRDEVAPNTFRRHVKKHDLLKPESKVENKLRLAFSKQYANDMWQADTMFGPYTKNGKTSTQAKLIAFIDDASRVLCHGEFFFSENRDGFSSVIRSALYKRGVPKQIYVDNGAIYKSKEIHLICRRIGTLLCHAPIRDGAAKGKIERFFRTVRDNFLVQKLDLSSLDKLNTQFTNWVENEYNCRRHRTLGMKPIDRFGMDIKRIHFLSPNEVNDELFFFEEDRQCKIDNTFSFKSTRWEAPRDLRNHNIQIRHNRSDPDSRVVVYYKGECMGDARPLDPVSNDRSPLKQEGGIL